MSPESFATSYEELYPQFYGYAIKRVRNPEIAEDLTQSAFLKAWEKQDRYTESGKFSSWAWQIMANTTTDHFRRGKETFAMPEDYDEGDVDFQLEQAGQLDEVRAVLEELPYDQAQMLMMRLLGWSLIEIREYFDLKPMTVGPRLYKARHNAQRVVEEKGFGSLSQAAAA